MGFSDLYALRPIYQCDNCSVNMDRLLRPSIALPLILSIGSCLYLIGLGIYRLYLHPLAKFPGPKLAALSRWDEFYYEVIRKGNFTLHLPALHRKYGKDPISHSRPAAN